ncbi:hypothetical protein TTHERM_00127190 (macronuclear) [Tetrahymena thermophila SB210]|uniref:Uncharacterized protein n=1 Tax=Tetrahymena thermophila (strain SB210) TaxID=312017 RepID=I7LUU3_TETTS|nr:hypothetical protein TTHERM_00127190 [Tetrahymena thermophila SB210]EAR96054.1 hypothetical protein TTHERM_00127190 [Tetrahymena thermophila SB210]|eukprot:XP_001016299.1 hypothetical protein TTHERM_00127190 [Tetrahymena thermophila SB210]
MISTQSLSPIPTQYNLLDMFLEIVNSSQDSLSMSQESEDYPQNEIKIEAVENYSKVKKSNIIKNILKSFQRYIENTSSIEQEELCLAFKKRYDFSQLKKLVTRNFKTFGKRWNMKLKHLIDQCSYKELFQYYLEYKSCEWLNSSKVQNKEDHKVVINFIVQALKNPEYRNEIKFYKKIKSITSDL